LPIRFLPQPLWALLPEPHVARWPSATRRRKPGWHSRLACLSSRPGSGSCESTHTRSPSSLELRSMADIGGPKEALVKKLSDRSATIAVVGLGYVGLPL